MRRTALLIVLLMFITPLTGCFGNEGNGGGSGGLSETLDEWMVHYAQTVNDLPTCDSTSHGRLYYVENNSEFQVCKTSGWTVINITGPQGLAGANGTNGLTVRTGQTAKMEQMVKTELTAFSAYSSE